MIRMKYLFDCWKEVEETLTPDIVLLLDYDGTLTPIVAKPELAVLSEEMRDVLRRASKLYTVGIISGRSLNDVKKLVKINGLYYAGNHGFEISGPALELVKPEAEQAKPAISTICKEMAARLSHINGAIVEDKGLTASVHYRLVAENNFQELSRIFDEVIKPHLESGVIRITRGKKVFEIRPNVEWDKGKAVLWMVDALKVPKGPPIYIGDDRTDEDAFLALKEKNGITILVTEEVKESNARYFVRSVNEVKEFLEKLIDLRAQG